MSKPIDDFYTVDDNVRPVNQLRVNRNHFAIEILSDKSSEGPDPFADSPESNVSQ